MVFETTDLSKGWNGRYKTIDCDIGTYFYLLELQKNYSDDVISHIEFDTAINDLHNQWSLLLLKNN
jgi:hypothetical protein